MKIRIIRHYFPITNDWHIWRYKYANTGLIKKACHSFKRNCKKRKKRKKMCYDKVSMSLLLSSDSPRCCMPLLRRMLHDKKIPVIPPPYLNISVIIKFEGKSEIFNLKFLNQCLLIENITITRSFFTPPIKLSSF